jgi:cytochrome c oxidase assembly protein subunit 11
MPQTDQPRAKTARRPHARTAFWLSLAAVGMLGLSYAVVPLYQRFCSATGFGGATQRASGPSRDVVDRQITVRFDTNTSSALNWDFRPEQRQVTLKIGENKLAMFRATNKAQTPLTGAATFNVTPEIAGSYFDKVQCFCFTEQTLQPGQTAEFPVSFFIDPAILNDPDAKNIEEITLSYTFFRANKDKAQPSRSSGGAASRPFEKAGSSG